jgi:hypothetical protein
MKCSLSYISCLSLHTLSCVHCVSLLVYTRYWLMRIVQFYLYCLVCVVWTVFRVCTVYRVLCLACLGGVKRGYLRVVWCTISIRVIFLTSMVPFTDPYSTLLKSTPVDWWRGVLCLVFTVDRVKRGFLWVVFLWIVFLLPTVLFLGPPCTLLKSTLADYWSGIVSTEYTEWQWPLSGAHSIMMVKSAQPGEGGAMGGCTPSLFHSIYHHKQSCGVHSSWEGRYTPSISPLPLYVLCVCVWHVSLVFSCVYLHVL